MEKVTEEELSKVIGFEKLAVKSWWKEKMGGFLLALLLLLASAPIGEHQSCLLQSEVSTKQNH